MDSVMRLHQCRRMDFRRGHVLGLQDHLVQWTKPPQRSQGLQPKDYARLSETLMWHAAQGGLTPARRLSFKGTIQQVLSLRDLLPRGQCRAPVGEVFLCLIAQQVVPYRPGRIEPRVRKRRPKNYRLMTRPREELKALLTG